MNELIAEKAAHHWNNGYYCAESVLLALAEDQHIFSELIPKIATAYCSGLSETSGMCGALSGAILGLSMVQGRGMPGVPRDRLYGNVQQLIAAFQAELGSIHCSQLLQLDLSTAAGHAAYQERQLSGQCEGYIRFAAATAARLLAEPKEPLPG